MRPAPASSSTEGLTPPTARAAVARGFTRVELMVSVVIGLLTTLIVAQVLLFSEGQKRSTTAGTDAQINGAQEIYALQRDLQMAGYGFASSPALIGCPVHARYNSVNIATGAAAPTLVTLLAPVVIDATDANRNTLRVLSSAKASFAVPTRILPPGYDPAGAGSLKTVFPVTSSLGVAAGDLLLAAKADASRCEAFVATAAPTVDGEINRVDAASTWNALGFPSLAYVPGDLLVNLGSVLDRRYSVSATNTLQTTEFSITTPTTAATPRDLHPHIVVLRALYGKDTNADGVVDLYDTTTPTTSAGWQQLRAIRLAVVGRSAQYEKELVTTAKPQWDVGASATVSGAADCGTSKCVTLDVEATVGTEWQHYRYKVFDTVIPLRNLLWTS